MTSGDLQKHRADHTYNREDDDALESTNRISFQTQKNNKDMDLTGPTKQTK